MAEIHSSVEQEELNDSSYERIDGMDGSPGAAAEQEHADNMDEQEIEEEDISAEIEVREETVSDQAQDQ